MERVFLLPGEARYTRKPDLVASLYGGGYVTGHLGAMETIQGDDVLRRALLPRLHNAAGRILARRTPA